MPNEKPSCRLEEAITSMVCQAAAEKVTLTCTKLVKLLYFLDLRAWDELAHTITCIEWHWHQFGPSSEVIVATCQDMARQGELLVEEIANAEGARDYRISAGTTLNCRQSNATALRLARSVLRAYGQHSASYIGDLSYETMPMRCLLQHGHRGDVIEFQASPIKRNDMREAVARYTALARKNPGKDSGAIASGLREEMHALAPARAAAMAALFPEE